MSAQQQDFTPIFQAAGQEWNVDPLLLQSVARIESRGNPGTQPSSAGAIGLMQIMPKTAEALGVQDPTDPTQAIFGAAKLLDQNLTRYGNVPDALRAYNAGTDQTHWNNAETLAYVPKVQAAYQRLAAAQPQAAAAPAAPANDAASQALASAQQADAPAPAADPASMALVSAQAPDAPPAVPAGPKPVFSEGIPGGRPPPAAAAPQKAPVGIDPASQALASAQQPDPPPPPPGMLSSAASAAWNGLQSGFMAAGPTGALAGAGMGAANALMPPDPTGQTLAQGAAAGAVAGWGDTPLGFGVGGSSKNPITRNELLARAGDAMMRVPGALTGALAGAADELGNRLGVPGIGSELNARVVQPLMLEEGMEGEMGRTSPLTSAETRAQVAQAATNKLMPPAAAEGETAAASAPANSNVPPQPVNRLMPEAEGSAPVPPVSAADTAATPAAPDADAQAGGIKQTSAPLLPIVTKAQADAQAVRYIDDQMQGGPQEINDSSNIPGMRFSMAQATANPRLAQAERTLFNTDPEYAQQVGMQIASNNRALLKETLNMTDTPEAVAAERAERDAQFKPMYDTVLNGAPPADRTDLVSNVQDMIDKNTGKPEVQKPLQAVLNNLNAAQVKDAPAGMSNPTYLYNALQSMGYALSKASIGTDAAGHAASAQMMQLKPRIENLIESVAPGFNAIRAEYAERSRSIDGKEYLQGLNLTNGNGDETLAKLDTAVKGLARNQAKSGPQKADSVTPEQAQTLTDLRDARRKIANSSLGMSLGSTSVQNLASIASNPLMRLGGGTGKVGLKEMAAGGAGAMEMWNDPATAPYLMTLGMARAGLGQVNARSQALLAASVREMLLNPNAYRAAKAKLMGSQTAGQ